jgi:hypothetical protein
VGRKVDAAKKKPHKGEPSKAVKERSILAVCSHLLQSNKNYRFWEVLMDRLDLVSLQKEIQELRSETKRQSQSLVRIKDLGIVLFEFLTDVDQKFLTIQNGVRNIGSGYEQAVKQHRDALKEADPIKARDIQAMFSVLTIYFSGGLSWLVKSTLLKGLWDLVSTRFGEVFKETVKEVSKDTAAAAVGEGFSAMGPVLFTPPPTNDGINQEPISFQNSLLNHINDWYKMVLSRLHAAAKALRRAKQKQMDNVDPDELESALETYKERFSSEFGIPHLEKIVSSYTVNQLSDMFERSMWAKWLPTLRSRVTHKRRPQVVHPDMEMGEEDTQTIYEKIYEPVWNRLKALEIPEPGFEIHWYQSNEDVDVKLITWANNFAPNPLDAAGDESAP